MRQVREVLHHKDVVAVDRKAFVIDAVQRMVNGRVGATLVMDGDTLAGIFTERDLLCRVVANGQSPFSMEIVRVMTRQPLTIDANRPFAEALYLMHENGFRHMPVTEKGRVIGVVSARDALGYETVACEQLAERYEAVVGAL